MPWASHQLGGLPVLRGPRTLALPGSHEGASLGGRGRVVLAAVVAALTILLGSFAVARWAAESRTPGGPAVVTANTPRSGLPTVGLADLPVQARETLGLVDRGGPFRYAKDGTTFQNFEGLLPQRPGGYYREYTVPTPGEGDRGARRLVVGRDGDVYYTDDHYRSFRQVIRD
ncbi:MAG TPA: ribonuclease domain-containing protein [Micromonosporaceae bacterium]|nr:ribonuclease domain-containing protein [Micromonosporaceae bacterium]